MLKSSENQKEWIWEGFNRGIMIDFQAKANIHQTKGKYHLLSYLEIGKLVSRPVEALPIKNFMGFSTIAGKRARTLAKSYFSHLSGFPQKTLINPDVVASVRK